MRRHDRLPQLLVLTDRRACERNGRRLVDVVSEVGAAADVVGLGDGDRPAVGVVLREKDLPRRDRSELASAMRDVVPCLIVASDIDVAAAVGADGIHLASTDAWPGDARHPTAGGSPLLVGRSCHDAHELADATHHGASYVTLSPIFLTSSKPGYGPALGPEALRDRPVPTFALGGVEPGRARNCVLTGAAGVAVMGSVMAAAEPGAVVAALLDEIDVARRAREKMPP